MTTAEQTPSRTRPARRRRATESLTLLGGVVIVALIAAACGSSTPNAASSTTTTAASPGGSTSSTTTAGGNGQVVANAVSNAKIGSPILVTAAGMTLYKLSADSAGTSVCTGTCASVWPPLTVPAGTTPKGGPGASAAFGTITRADGTVQVTYAGHPVYTFSGDSSAGATSGNNIMSFGGTWTVLSAGTGATPAKNTTATTKAPSGGGYGY